MSIVYGSSGGNPQGVDEAVEELEGGGDGRDFQDLDRGVVLDEGLVERVVETQARVAGALSYAQGELLVFAIERARFETE